jgi:FkbM family methyltransferase
VKFSPEALKARLIDRLESARPSAAAPSPAEPQDPAPAAEAEAPTVPAEEPAYVPVSVSAEMQKAAESSPAKADWESAVAAIAESQRSLSASVEHLSRRCDHILESLRRRETDLHVDLVLQRMKATEIGEALGRRIAAIENVLLGKVDAVAADIGIREEGIRAALRAQEESVSASLAGVRSEIGAGIERTTAAESLLSGKLDAVAADIGTREEGIRAALRAQGQAAPRPVLAGRDVLITRVDDFVLAVPREDWILAAYYVFWGTLERGMTLCLQSILRPGMVFVDVGANIGIHTLHAARAVGATGTVHSFEPSPNTFRVLQQNVRANGLTRVELHQVALLDKDCEVPFYQIEGMCGWNNLFAGSDEGTAVPVKATTLDEALPQGGRIDIVKIDAEGAEPLIWRGMRRVLAENPQIRILIEFAPIHLRRAGSQPDEFLREIAAAGFRISRIEDESGELGPFDPAELEPAAGANLLLERPGA